MCGLNFTRLSPEAQDAKRAAKERRSLYEPNLFRTKTKAIIKRPYGDGRHFHAKFSWYIRDNLPRFTYNKAKDWWEAPIAELVNAYNVLCERYKGCWLSDGAKQYIKSLEPQAIIEYRFQAYTPPDDNNAFGLKIAIVESLESLSGDLLEVRRELLEKGYKQVSLTPVSYYEYGKFFPLWREVWSKKIESAP